MEPITFGITNLSGNASVNPTGIAFSKTGNPTLFVAQQHGTVYRYEVERSPDGPDADDTDEFAATSSLAIEVIQDDTQNFDDDGALNSNQKRQVTGLATTPDDRGTDCLFVSSSDPGGGGGVRTGRLRAVLSTASRRRAIRNDILPGWWARGLAVESKKPCRVFLMAEAGEQGEPGVRRKSS